jgi:ornithine decarboxylase
MLSFGVKPNHIIFANPCKQRSHMKYAVAHGVDLTTFDNEMELLKVKALAPNSR